MPKFARPLLILSVRPSQSLEANQTWSLSVPSGISTRILRRELMRIRINRPPSGTPPSKDTASQWLVEGADQRAASLCVV
jgi:hypothetical protein